MKAALQTEYGPPSVVSVVDDVPRPTPGDGELLVEVRATTVNRTDCGFRAASPPIVRLFSGLRRPKRPILGNEFAGVVVETGPGVSVSPSAIGSSATSRVRSAATPST